jgi:acetyl esterase/lipase
VTKISLRILRGSLAGLFACATLLAAQSTSSPNDATSPAPILLWPNGAPGAAGDTPLDKPTLTPYLPAQNPTHTAIVVCPGGGYAMLAIDKEGTEIAHWLNTRGVAAFVLTYRYGPRYHHPIPLLDAERAIRYVRSHAGEDAIDPDRIGIMGFSAGGHLASTAGTHFDTGNPDATDPIEQASSRPDFMVLAYPSSAWSRESRTLAPSTICSGNNRTRCLKTSSPMKPRSRRKLHRRSSSVLPTMRLCP